MGGATTFVLPGEDVEVKVAQVFRRLEGPVLAAPSLRAVAEGGAPAPGRVRDLFPERLPDLRIPDRAALPDVDLGAGTFERTPAAEAAVAELVWRAGDKVRHRRFGEGIVVSSQWVSGDEEVTVAFEGQGVRRLIGSYAGLERLT